MRCYSFSTNRVELRFNLTCSEEKNHFLSSRFHFGKTKSIFGMERMGVETEHGVEIGSTSRELPEGSSSHCFIVKVGMPTQFPSHLLHSAQHHLLGTSQRIHLDSKPARPIVGIRVLAVRDNGPIVPAAEHTVEMEQIRALRKHQILPRQQHVQAKRLDVTPPHTSTSMKLSPYCGVK